MEPQLSEIKVLTDLGLTLVQARIYLALIQSGISKISTVSKISKVARPDIYNNLSKLQDLGLVERIIQSPLAYRAIPMIEGLTFLLERKKEQFKKVRAETQILINENKINRIKKIEQIKKYQFAIIPRGTAIKRIGNAIEKAQLSINFVLSWKKFVHAIMSVFAESMEIAWTTNVKNRFIVEFPSKNETAKKMIHFCREKPFFQIRFASNCPKTNFIICDKKEVYMIINPKTDLRSTPVLWSDNSSLIALLAEYFETTWLTSACIKIILHDFRKLTK